jgi:hypothetical protein
MKKFLLSLILCSVFAIQLPATELDVPQDAQITITGNRLTLQSFISQVEKQTNYLFVYSKQDVNVNEILPVKEGRKTVAACLEEAFRNTNLKYVFENNYIVLTYVAPETVTISGKIVDSETRRPLIFASIYLVNRGISNVTNGEGYFTLKFPVAYTKDSVRISFLATIRLPMPSRIS